MTAANLAAQRRRARARSPAGRLGRRLLWPVVGTNLILAVALAVALAVSHRRHLDDASRSAQNLARLSADGVTAELDRVDLAVHAAVDACERNLAAGVPATTALQLILDQQRSRAPSILGLRVVDARGDTVLGVPAIQAGVSLADRDYFKRLQDRSSRDAVLTGPVEGRLVKTPVVILSRRVSGPDGAFAGVVNGTIEVATLSRLVAGVDVGRRGIVTLRSSGDGALVASSLPVALGSTKITPALQERLRAGHGAGTYTASSAVDGVERTFAFRQLRGYPLFVVVGLGRSDFLGEWRRELAGAVVVLVLFAAASAFAVAQAAKAFRKRVRITRSLARHNQRLRESEERFRTLFRMNPDAVGLTRLTEGTVADINEAFTRTLGWTREALVGRSTLEVGVWADPEERLRIIHTLRDEGTVRNAEVRIRTRAGEVLTCLLSGQKVMLRGAPYLLTITRDIGEWKRSREERDRLQAQVQHAQKLDSVGQLAGGVAHDFNNLLTVVLSCTAELRETLARGAAVDPDAVEQIEAAGRRASELTRKLLAFARKQVFSPVSLDLNAVVQESATLLHRTLRENIALEVRLQDGLWPVWCDPVQVQQVVLNLAVNAADAMSAGGRLTIETRNAQRPAARDGEGPSDRVEVVVRDTGVGMSAEVKAHLFEPFFTTKPPGKGTGLGLAIVHGIVTQSGGEIAVDSEEGRGTCFTLRFPRTHARADERPRLDRTSTRGSETVLVVEDDALVRGITVKVLEGAGYEVLQATDAADARRVTADGALRSIDLLVTDMVMPGDTGQVLATELCKARPALRVLIVSGYTRDGLEPEEPGARSFPILPKPYAPAELLRRVRQVLDERRPPMPSRPDGSAERG